MSVHPDVLLSEEALRDEAIRAAKVRPHHVRAVHLRRKAIDARRGRVRLQLVVEVEMMGDSPPIEMPTPAGLPTLSGVPEVIIVGAGPSGMFCALALAEAGVRSLVLERGKDVRARRRDLALLARSGTLNPESNYCYGEGGAGTFSDGKLYTRSSKRGDVEQVLRHFVGYGASSQILVDARPHIGTNKLPGVVSRMREHLQSAGVEFAFDSRVDEILTRDGCAIGVELGDGRKIEARAVVVATGHSARGIQRAVARAGARVEAKSFAVGVRVEHAQSFIDANQFGEFAGHAALGAASYRIVERSDDVGVFSFCMCPGGFMAPAATESGCQVVNGWSPSSRGGRFANSGFVVEVGAELLSAAGLDPADPFSGSEFQRTVEGRAYRAGGGNFVAPAQRISDFVEERASKDLPRCSYPVGVTPAELDGVLGLLAAPLRHALRKVDRRIPGFASRDAVAVGVESRTSSPVRVVRDRETSQSTLPGLYPCAEGAGYAGGIMSAALDGFRVAAGIVKSR